MTRAEYQLFTPGRISHLITLNRLVRSATWDPSIINMRQMSEEVLKLYRELALGGVGLIITGGFPVFEERTERGVSDDWFRPYTELKVNGIEQLVEIVKEANPKCIIVAQLENGNIRARPSEATSVFTGNTIRGMAESEIWDIIQCYVDGIVDMQKAGFDGVQLHAAHGALIGRFLSPFSNQRTDSFGGSTVNRVRVIREIVTRARAIVGDFPILIKMNCTEYVDGGIDSDTFPELAEEVENAGIDAIEVSGGIWECLVMSEEELGFRPVPAPESHTRIGNPEKQSYFLKHAEKLDLRIPVILVGGNRDVERLERIISDEAVDFIALSRPLIREPDLPNRWMDGKGSTRAECISCNSCIYDMHVNAGLVRCVHKEDKDLHQKAQDWLESWVKEHTKV